MFILYIYYELHCIVSWVTHYHFQTLTLHHSFPLLCFNIFFNKSYKCRCLFMGHRVYKFQTKTLGKDVFIFMVNYTLPIFFNKRYCYFQLMYLYSVFLLNIDIQLNLFTTATLGTKEYGCWREVAVMGR